MIAVVEIVQSSRALYPAGIGVRNIPGSRAVQVVGIIVAALCMVWLVFSPIGNITASMR